MTITDADLRLLTRATDGFGAVLARTDLTGDDAGRCAGWTLRDVANHVLGGAIRYQHYFSGGDPAEVAWSRTADHAGGDAAAAHRRVSAMLNDRITEHRGSAITLHHPLADIDVPTLLVLRVQELVLHGWDIASVAAPSVTIDPALGVFLLERGASVRTLLRDHGALGPEHDPGAEADLTARVLAAWGRWP
ncbi:maleylpyruvate isomerase N-terminal domain-containing protein [Tomitella gaofuii]|uniref:maleylpyruvate isomerase N-terminal domain-containing protein n=1 Tax=Tomitella gaofuii TaxID=2760083 RepID=UPI0015F7F8B4|nr:maleylpyruvate isomerase N-terminal domain-containing protein [Tomitella gaofuii]